MNISHNSTHLKNPETKISFPALENSVQDEAFWQNLEIPPNSKNQESEYSNPEEVIEIENKDQMKDPKAEPIQNPLNLRQKFRQKFDFDYQKQVIERILLSGQQKAAEEAIRVKNQTKKELFPAVKETVQGIQKDLILIHEESFNLKEKLVMTHHTLKKIEKVLKIQCKATSRIDFYSNFIKPFKKPKKPKKNAILNEYQAMQKQLGCLKVLASEFQRDSEIALQGVSQIKKEILALNDAHSARIAKLKTFYEEQESTVADETRRIRTEFRRFKEFAHFESEAREILNKRQAEFIAKLYQELGNTKFIIQNPRLRTQYHRKVTGKVQKQENSRNENLSLTFKLPETPESFSLAQTRPVTNDLKFSNGKDEDESISFKIVTRFRNSFTPFK